MNRYSILRPIAKQSDVRAFSLPIDSAPSRSPVRANSEHGRAHELARIFRLQAGAVRQQGPAARNAVDWRQASRRPFMIRSLTSSLSMKLYLRAAPVPVRSTARKPEEM